MQPLSTTHVVVAANGISDASPGAFVTERAGRFLCPNEMPLRPDLRLSEPEQFYDRVGCPKASLSDLQAVELIVANVIEADHRAPGTAIFYSRDRNYYDQPACAVYSGLLHLCPDDAGRCVARSARTHRAPEDGAVAARPAPVAPPRSAPN